MRIVGGSQRGQKLSAPPGRTTRPPLDRTRESVFSILGDAVEGVRVLDLFAGAGAFGLEALSRGARRAHFVERSRRALAVLRQNIARLGFERLATVECGDALVVPDATRVDDERFGLIFLDPPFAFFRDPAEAARVGARVVELLGREGGRGGARTIVLRQPSWHRGEPPAEPSDVRRYGESTVLFFSTTGGTAWRNGA